MAPDGDDPVKLLQELHAKADAAVDAARASDDDAIRRAQERRAEAAKRYARHGAR